MLEIFFKKNLGFVFWLTKEVSKLHNGGNALTRDWHSPCEDSQEKRHSNPELWLLSFITSLDIFVTASTTTFSLFFTSYVAAILNAKHITTHWTTVQTVPCFSKSHDNNSSRSFKAQESTFARDTFFQFSLYKQFIFRYNTCTPTRFGRKRLQLQSSQATLIKKGPRGSYYFSRWCYALLVSLKPTLPSRISLFTSNQSPVFHI